MLDTRFIKILRDLTERKGRTILTMLGLFVGLWAVAAMAISWFVLSNDLSANYSSTVPPGIVMTLIGENRLNVDDLGEVEGINSIENRPFLLGRAEINPGQTLPIIAWVVEDFDAMEIAKITSETGQTTPPIGTVLMERNALALASFYRRTKGKPIVVQQPYGGFVTVPVPMFDEAPFKVSFSDKVAISTEISGVVHDPGVAPAVQEQVLYAWVTYETAAKWIGAGIQNRLIIKVAEGYESDKDLRAIASLVGERVLSAGYAVNLTQYPSTTEHPHQFQLDSALFLLSGVGLLALLMSIILVMNLINAILTSQIRQIGILKAIGASTFKVSCTYLGAMALLGGLASLVAIPMALGTGYDLARWISNFLNFKILTSSLPPLFTACLYALGILFPVMAAYPSVKKWSKVSVSDALQYNGSNPQDETGVLFGKLPDWISMNARMGIRNAFRKPQRMLLTAATLGLGILVFMITLNVRSSLQFTAETEIKATQYDVNIQLKNRVKAEELAFLSDVNLVEKVELWNVRRSFVEDENGIASEAIPLKVMPEGSKAKAPAVLEGEWFSDSSPSGVVINYRLQNLYPGLTVGSFINLQVMDKVHSLEIIGVIKEFMGKSVYIRDKDYQRIQPGDTSLFNTAFVTLTEKTSSNLGSLLKDLEAKLANEKLNVLSVTSSKLASRVIDNHLGGIVAILLAMAAVMLFVGVLGMASGISTTIVERTREIGVLRAIGGRPSSIRMILTSESIVMALIGWLMALLLAQPLSQFLSSYFGAALVEYPFDYRGSMEGVIISLAGTLVLAVAATLVPSYLASRISVKAAISYE